MNDRPKSGEPSRELDGKGRPVVFNMGIHTGMLESLGLNMYTSIGKSLAEFVANAYDADAKEVRITVPFDEIDDARKKVREQAKQDVEQQKRDKFNLVYDPLPDSVCIVIRDNGHGMSANEIENKFLMINRNRRLDADTSESGTRYVMGRKGLGKLAGFGAAERITVKSKRKNENYATCLKMDFNEIKKVESINNVVLKPTYEDNLNSSAQWTEITLSGLRCDAIRARVGTVTQTLAQNFAILGDDFKVFLNNARVVEQEAEYEFHYPENGRDAEGFASADVKVGDIFSYPIRYFVRFRARAEDEDENKLDSAGDGGEQVISKNNDDKDEESEGAKKRGSLPTGLRGARIYCNKRLTHGPSLLDLHTGMHNFHSQAYMECIVHADELDKNKHVDHIGTNRAELKRDNEIVEALFRDVTEIMRLALYQHGKFRDAKAERQLEKNPFSKGILETLSRLSTNTQKPAKKILTVLASQSGVKSELFQEVAPLMLKSMNAGEVLMRLISLGSDPKSVSVVAHELAELERIEIGDVIKLYRGRRDGIVALQKLQERGDAAGWGGPQFEQELHTLLKANAWLIKAEYSRWLTSDKDMGEVARKLNKRLGIDTGAKKSKKSKQISKDRPDLVFALVDATEPAQVSIVELKSPGLPLDVTHLTQLEGYIAEVEQILANDYGRAARVHGYLIGSVPDAKSKSRECQTLLSRMRKAGPQTQWEVISIPKLLERARKTHIDAIDALEKEEKKLEEETT